MKTLSAVVLVQNNQNEIEKCLRALKFCDEIVVIDDESSDKTAEIAKKMGAMVYQRKVAGDFASQRNYGLNKCRGEWVLFVDSDEVVSKNLALEIRKSLDDRWDGYLIRRQDWFGGKKLKGGEWGKIWLLRLAKKSMGIWQREVHEVWKVDGKIGRLNRSLDHFAHKNIEDFLNKVNDYSQIDARIRDKNGQRFNLMEVLCYPLGKFIRNYFGLGGWRDGRQGLMYSVIMSCYTLCVRIKLYEKQLE